MSAMEEYAELSALSCPKLVAQCKKHGLSTKYRLKVELVKRLGQFFDNNDTHLVPCEEFFDFVRTAWKKTKKRMLPELADCSGRPAWWRNCAAEVRKQLQDANADTLEPYQLTTRKHLQKILSGENSGAKLYRYYLRGKSAWLSADDSSTGEEDAGQEETAAAGTNTAGACTCVCMYVYMPVCAHVFRMYLYANMQMQQALNSPTKIILQVLR